jgi:hypothetical protein
MIAAFATTISHATICKSCGGREALTAMAGVSEAS